jgi:GalNAc-alpha-(1->4)-GalNAc-alpha-(1->3)-diNAcBac-PP-undecaprenol alpha-1,4-N-acetyl-D-galactosaminyltransferase
MDDVRGVCNNRARRRLRITFVNYGLHCGGAERTISLLANAWSEIGHQVTVVTLSSDLPFFRLRADIRHVALGLQSNSKSVVAATLANLARISRLRSAIGKTQPDVIVSFTVHTNIRVLLATAGLGVPRIICERTDPQVLHVGPFWSFLRRLTYRNAEAVQCLTDNVARWVEPLVTGIVAVIPNPVLASTTSTQDSIKLRGQYRVAAMGRLHPVKGFELLFRAFARISSQFSEWSLILIGEGSERVPLERLRDELGLRDRIRLLGKLENPNAVLRDCHLFVLSSSREGFPGALCEAMACGLPVISFDCPSGPRFIVRHGVDGLLVNSGDLQGLQSAMELLMSNRELRTRMAARGPEIVERFGMQTFMDKWNSLLGELLPQLSAEKLSGQSQKC